MEMTFDSFSEVANAFIQVIASPGFTGASVVQIVRPSMAPVCTSSSDADDHLQ